MLEAIFVLGLRDLSESPESLTSAWPIGTSLDAVPRGLEVGQRLAGAGVAGLRRFCARALAPSKAHRSRGSVAERSRLGKSGQGVGYKDLVYFGGKGRYHGDRQRCQ